MKQKLTTGMLFISAVLLGAFIWFFERGSETSRLHEIRNQKIFTAYPADINWIRMERGDTTIECTRAAGIWRMTHPVDAPVNNAVVEKMIAGMANVERGELISSETMKERGLTSSDYGFDEPRATITFRNNRGTFTWLIGRDAPLGDTLYIMAADSRDIISAPQTLLNLVPEDAAWIRDRTLFKYTAASVRGIDLRRITGGFIQLRQTDENRWIMQQPFSGDADRLQVHKLIDRIIAATIHDFTMEESSDLTVYGLEEPDIELSLLDQNEHPQTLLIGKPMAEKPEALYAKWSDSPAVFTVSTNLTANLGLDSKSLRGRTLISEPLSRISQISITSTNTQIDLLRTNNLWKVTRPSLWEAEPESVQLLLDTLAAGTVTEFVDTPNAEQTEKITRPLWTITLTTGNSSRTLRINRSGNLLLIQRDEEPSFCLTDSSSLLDDWLANPLFYRNHTLLEIEPPQIKSVELETAGESFRVEKTEDSFSATDRMQTPDPDVMAELTAQLIQLRTEQFIALNPESLQPYGLDNPTARLTITLNSTNTLGQVILFGKAAKGGRYAMLRGQPVVFVLPEKTAEILTRKLTLPVEEKPTETEQP